MPAIQPASVLDNCHSAKNTGSSAGKANTPAMVSTSAAHMAAISALPVIAAAGY